MRGVIYIFYYTAITSTSSPAITTTETAFTDIEGAGDAGRRDSPAEVIPGKRHSRPGREGGQEEAQNAAQNELERQVEQGHWQSERGMVKGGIETSQREEEGPWQSERGMVKGRRDMRARESGLIPR